MLRMLDRHAVRALREAGRSTKEIAVQFGVSQRTRAADLEGAAGCERE